jgi:transcriptional regulator with XRE-family HTH domain
MTLGEIAQELAQLVARRRTRPQTEPFGARLARLRKARGYTQTELGELLAVTQRVVTSWESQGRIPPAEALPRLSEVLGVRVEALLGTAPLREPEPPQHTRLWRKLREAEKLPEADRKAVLRFIDALLTRQRLQASARG